MRKKNSKKKRDIKKGKKRGEKTFHVKNLGNFFSCESERVF